MLEIRIEGEHETSKSNIFTVCPILQARKEESFLTIYNYPKR